MARTGLSKSQVRASRDQVLAEGRYPSVDTVRLALGNTGSKSTIHKYLKELETEDADGGLRREDTARTLLATVEQLAEQLHADGDRRLRALKAEHAQALQEKDDELAELRRQVAMLGARLDRLEDLPGGGDRSFDKGFGKFSDQLLSSRGGGHDISPFSFIPAGGRSEVFDFDSLIPARLKFPTHLI
jgi:hypothetical protein